MRVLHVISAARPGDGITEVVKNIASSIDRGEFEISLCSLQGRGDGATDFERIGCRVFALNAKSSTSPKYVFQNIYTVWQLARLIRAERFDVIHTHELFSGTLGRIAGWLAGAPVIILSLHNTDFWKRRHHILIDRLLSRVTHKIVANSEAVKQFTTEHERIPPEKFVVIHNGIDISRFGREKDGDQFRQEYGIKPLEIVVGTVGRLAEQKGQRYFIEAARIICDQRKEVKFVIVGGDTGHPKESVKEELYQQVKGLGLEDVVIFTGLRRDLPQIMAGFDIFVLPSLWEGFGLAVAEAMAAGKPVVASRIPAVSEVVEEGESGILVHPGDAEAIAKAVLELVDSPEKALAMGEVGRRRVEEIFSSKTMTKEYEALYCQLFAKAGVSR